MMNILSNIQEVAVSSRLILMGNSTPVEKDALGYRPFNPDYSILDNTEDHPIYQIAKEHSF